MVKLSDYMDQGFFRSLRELFARATGCSLRLLDADGAALAEPDKPVKSGGISVYISSNDAIIGRLLLEDPDPVRYDALAGMLELLADIISRMCEKENELRDRVEELRTLYGVTALFTGPRSLRNVLDTVAQTVVDVLGVKACGLRLLNRQTGELTIEAACNLSREYLNKGVILLAKSELDRQAIESNDVVYIPDERTDPRVLFPDEARREGIVSALIVPLIYKGGPVGALRLYTGDLHEFTKYEVALARAIADQAASAIVNAQLYNENVQAEAIRRQMKLAGEVQRRMIPARAPSYRHLDIGAIYAPSLELCGDFYDFLRLDAANLGVVVCDVMGKGIPASLLTAAIRASLRAQADNLYDLTEVMTRVNRSLHDDTLTTSFATLCYGVIDTKNLKLTYTNAGHEPPLLLRGDQTMALETGGLVLGVEPDTGYPQSVVPLEIGDTLILLTDGLTEARNFSHEQYGVDRIVQAARTALEKDMAAQDIARHILWDMRRFTGLHRRDDDVTLVVIRIT